ncbi:hypothetical protein B0I26_1092 [Anoxybacillus vitaminiphilus]|uniref:Uncharacterized protein n=1 Tax=Paranoxybacillus vitaminiphilus TaxID=581036 RepID=A0A327YFI5_9BACL|nr:MULTISPECIES: hypothetical protein [Anoxybacillus]MCZ0755884.1 hypothetical protein [Anoxybacillus sp. J5B_2022]RAK18585.1 hypothetical protein B0I26_1092 [Anoxybacillus vitaminiphilus]
MKTAAHPGNMPDLCSAVESRRAAIKAGIDIGEQCLALFDNILCLDHQQSMQHVV